MALRHRKCEESGPHSMPTQETSMCSLIIWNISKALEKRSCLDLRQAIRSAHERLERESRDCDGMTSQPPELRHLTCALLAWQQLGHKDADSLYQFVEENRCKPVRNDSENSSNQANIAYVNKTCASSPKTVYKKHFMYYKDTDTSSFDTVSLMGPVVKLPVETRIVMRMENPCEHHSVKKPSKLRTQNDLSNKIDAACCKDSVCVQRLAELDTAVKELRSRAAKLARREAERGELLERAEAAWKDLELGYQRRLRLAEEKEDDLENQIKKTIEERNTCKNTCTSLAETLKQRGEVAEKEKLKLVQIDNEVCERACVRLRFSEESSLQGASLAEQLCKTTQLDRDLQFKEEQARRKIWVIENDIESVRCLTHEAERAMRVELAALKDQIKQVSEQLLTEQSDNDSTKQEVEELLREKSDIIEDLEGCKQTCGSRVQGKMDELNRKRDLLRELKEKVLDCQCKLPIDIAVEAKRTPSLAALCQCAPEDKLLESCSCTSLRSQLLSNLLADLFGGLQSELSGSGSIMPCQLLKCLEEKHNWDRSSVVKTNLRNFFAQLLVGELDIAIATSIEKYHAKWVGKSCADQIRADPDYGEDEGWQERAIERRAQKLASKLAEQLFKERADELTKRAKDIVSKGPPPCQCKNQTAVYPCIVKSPITNNTNRKTNGTAPTYLKRTIQDVTQLRLQIEDLKKETVKKEDLWQMQDKIAKMVLRASTPDNIPPNKNAEGTEEIDDKVGEKLVFPHKYTKIHNQQSFARGKLTQKRNLRQNLNNPLSGEKSYKTKTSGKVFKRTEQSYAVHVCLCGTKKISNKVIKNHRLNHHHKSWNSKTSRDIMNKLSRVKDSKPITFLSSKGNDDFSSNRFSGSCPSKCVCFHKIPSNTSIDKLLETLIKWKGDLTNNSVGKYDKINKSEQRSDFSCVTGGCDQLVTNNCELVANIKSGNCKSAKNTSEYPKFSVTGYKTCYKVNDKSTDYDNLLPTTTDSVYIGEINLDRSNDDICKCNVKQFIEKVNCGYGNDRSSNLYTCVINDTCECVKIPEINQLSKTISKVTIPNKNVSVELKISQSKNVEHQNSKQSFSVNEHPFICNHVKNSEVFPADCDYQIKLLGVTLTNTNKLDDVKKIKENTMRFKGNDQIESSLIKMLSDNKSQMRCNIIDSKNRELFQLQKFPLNDCQNNTENEISDIKRESFCVCCDSKNLSTDLELNVFNLIEEHLKEKLEDLQRKCKSTCIPHQEEKQLFSSILQKVKEVISDSTNPLICKCTGLNFNEVSWSRAYGLLQEYIKVKIKRVQCECVQNDRNKNSILPGILEKICNLIETDFQRLKEKCKCGNKINNENRYLKESDKQFSATIQTTEMYAEVEETKKKKNLTKHMEDVSFQVSSHVPLEAKSCGGMNEDFRTLNTAEKIISCELRNVHVTDCSCRHKNSTPYFFNKEIYVSPITTSNVVMSNENDRNALFPAKVNDKIFKSSNISSSVSLNKDTAPVKYISDEFIPNTVIKYPYYGYTLNCSCDRMLGNCHCIKSMDQANKQKIDFMWKSLLSEKHPTKMSYIMSKIPTNVKSEHMVMSDNSDSLYLDNLLSEQDVNYCSKENVTSTHEHLVLKQSRENADILNNVSVGNDTVTDINVKKYLHWHDCSEYKLSDTESIQNDAEFEKHLLYDSLCLPTDKFLNETKNAKSTYFDANLESDGEKCDCKMVPVCHVKMLVESIEKRITELKCTCDSLSSRICPVHSRGEFYFN